MKVEAKDFGTNQQWKALGSDIAKLKGDVDCLAVKVDRVHSSAHELLRFIDTVKVITLTAIMFLMTYLLVTQFIG
jgi:hypothetical protein